MLLRMLIIHGVRRVIYCYVRCNISVSQYPEANIYLQEDLDALYQWSLIKSLLFNPEKCKHMLISRKQSNTLSPPTFTLGMSHIERTHVYKYLGISITSNLSWSQHISLICTRAMRLLGLIYRKFYFHSI